MTTSGEPEQHPARALLNLESPLLRRFNVLSDLYRSVRVSWRLLRDSRVSLSRKAIPVAVVLYVVLPIDLLPALIAGPLGLVDDVVVLAVGLDLFIRSVPAEIVDEHLRALGYEPLPALPEDSAGPGA